VIEALTQACRGRDIDIDVFVGSSVGSINAFCAFVDALAPAPALVQGVFAARQSALWKRYGSGNHAADDLLDRAWIVKYATDEWPLPIVGRFAALEQQLSDTWDRLKHHLDDIGRAAGDLRKAATNPPGSLTMETALAVRQLDADTAALLRHLHDLQNAWNSLHVADIFKDPRKFIRELDRVRIEVGNVWGDTLRVEVDLLAVPLSLVSDVMIDAIGYIGPLVKAVFDLLTAIAVVVGDAGELIGEAAAFVGLLEEALALLTLAAAVEAELLVGVGETAVLVNHIFTQNRIRSALTDFATQAIGRTPPSRVADELLHRAAMTLQTRARLLEIARHHPSHRLRIEPLSKRLRIRHVGEHHRHRLPPLPRRTAVHRQLHATPATELEANGILHAAALANRHPNSVELQTEHFYTELSAV
jgi:hypothetical protein